MKNIPNLSFWKLWNISFGFFGVQIAYALQSANISRIFATLGADPHNLSYFWILPPLMGILIQPIIGVLSDRTHTLPLRRGCRCSTGHVRTSKCRKPWINGFVRNDIRSHLTHVP